jgi:DNA-binding NarL/FixJ family response regulator
MDNIPVSVEESTEKPGESNGRMPIRVIVADTQAIFRAGLRKIFALEDDIRVVGQAENYPQTLSAAKKFSTDILIFEAALSPNPADGVAEILRQSPGCKLVVVTETPDEELTLELFRRGAHAIVSREIEP